MEFIIPPLFKVLIVGIMLYGIIFITLKKMAFLGDERVSALVAFLAAVIVSFSGIVTYIVSYAITWISIILIILFFIFLILMFLGMKFEEITELIPKKAVFGIMIVLLLIILLKGFFGVNNTFDLSDPQNNSYDVDTSFNTGVDDITNSEVESSWFDNFNIDSELLGIVAFFVLIGGAIFFIG